MPHPTGIDNTHDEPVPELDDDPPMKHVQNRSTTPTMKTPTAVCFDLDDTLFDYHEYARAGLHAAADHLETLTDDSYHEELTALYFEEDRTEGTFDLFLERHDLASHLAEELIEEYHAASTSLSPYTSTVPVLTELAETYKLGLVTDGRGGRAKLRRLGIQAFFDAVLVTPTIESSKRNPAVFDRILDELSVAPETTAYVGDDPRFDFEVPNELGMTTVRLRRGRYTDLEPATESAVPDHEISDLVELLEFF